MLLLLYADSLIMSSRLFSAGCWPALTDGEARTAHSMIMAVYRAAGRFRPVDTEDLDADGRAARFPEAHDNYVLALLHRPPPEALPHDTAEWSSVHG